MKRLFNVVAALAVFGAAGSANAAGYDTPMLYSARHLGMGGAANAYVEDASALFHNPAGLAHIKKLSLLGDFSLLVGGIQSSPDNNSINVDSNPVIAPFFLVGGGIRLTDWLVAGAAVYPVASASAAYEYQNGTGADVENSTKLVFIETTAGAAVNIDAARLTIGAGYRLTFVSLARTISIDGTDSLAFDMSGWNLASFRAGVQWEAIPEHLALGFSYRHKTVTEVTQDVVKVPTLFGGTVTDGHADFTLPARLIFGVRGDYDRFGAAVDVEYALNSQNDSTDLVGTDPGGTKVTIPNVFEWDDAMTLRLGAEYRIPMSETWRLIPRLGFIFDARTSKKKYPTAFGTPPGPTYVFTGGLGYERGPYNFNLAYAYRFGGAEVTKADLDSGDRSCPFCSKPGDYKLFLNGIYVDFSYDFE